MCLVGESPSTSDEDRFTSWPSSAPSSDSDSQTVINCMLHRGISTPYKLWTNCFKTKMAVEKIKGQG